MTPDPAPAALDEPVIERPPERVDRLLLPTPVLANTLRGLSLARDRELVCYWIGAAVPPAGGAVTRAAVLTVAFPRVVSGYDAFELAEGEMGRINNWCARSGLWILAQVHTHPTDEPHSEADESGPVSHRPGFLSVVIPFFAQMSTVLTPHWRLHEHTGRGAWRQVDPDTRIERISDVWLSPGY